MIYVPWGGREDGIENLTEVESTGWFFKARGRRASHEVGTGMALCCSNAAEELCA